ncbi:hypothetical protein GOODEAATRI_004908 [Goodea atripinnis]|uniref:Uncharacterized protein n=1 Tax=Goodea atripinnis TaxID=208336 RepID=A0ABV0P1V2_9TELE
MAFRRRNKSYPFFSQEFLIQNHADIVFSLVIFILIGLMFEVKFFYLTQLAYWLHALPELYFQKVRKVSRGGPGNRRSSGVFDLWAASFVFTRMATLTLMFLAVGFGLARSENQGLDLEMGNFNTVLIR